MSKVQDSAPVADTAPESGPARGRPPRGRRAGPGRPEGTSNVRDQILDAAELEFANLGYAGTSLRNVADRAEVTQALISYYFGSKHGLFEEVFLRRGRKIADERMERLEALRRGPTPPAVRDIVYAFLMPALAMRETEGGRTFMRLQARLHTEPPEISYRLRNEAYDASTRIFAAALKEALPHLSERDVYWRMTLMIGAYLYAFSDTHRLEELAPGICNPGDPDEIITEISSFVSAGMLAPVPDPVRAPGKRKRG
ncbi:TetR family transcriptional regulator [Azospirillum formosense]|uniref:TetR family transcriptional regulator n=1 Tax=Azospirillum formosense TaxID=861533 RepID=A0ABX2LB51_9PROT|nr:TetR/AcrR family transcriptional regulator [Azospirillum formosense]MBY3756446.1 TetR/AcrR family transcriptional regulator [Azospirillum formosense]NUB22948.1 TetR family transcriptional regulator [Azospirillum formosense]